MKNAFANATHMWKGGSLYFLPIIFHKSFYAGIDYSYLAVFTLIWL